MKVAEHAKRTAELVHEREAVPSPEAPERIPTRVDWSRLDEGLDESFPASDPVSAGTLENEARKQAQEG